MSKKTNNNRTVERKIYFYKVVCFNNEIEISLNDVFEKYAKQLNDDYKNLEERHLIIPYFEKYHFLEIKKHEFDSNIYLGKFYSLRSTDFPYLFNVQSGDRKEITSNDQDTLMEQTHFAYFSNQKLIVCEYNFYGARIEKLSDYLIDIMRTLYPSIKYDISITPIIIPEYFTQIVNCTSISKYQFKVAHPGLKILEEEGIIGITDVLKDNIDENSDFCIDIELSGGGRGKNLSINKTQEFLNKIISAIRKGNKFDLNKPDDEEPAFRKAKIKAYNPSECKIIPYDLLDEKLVQTCYVEKVSNKSKYVNSEKMFEKIFEAFTEQKDNALLYMGKDYD